MRLFTYLAAILLCGVSMSFSVALWYSEQPTLLFSIFFGVSAAGLELCKFIFFPAARDASGWSKFTLNFFGWILIGFSVFATVSLLESGAITNIDTAKNTSFEYQSQLKTVENIESEIQINMQLKAKAAENNYRKESRAYDLTLDNLEADKQKAIVILNDMTTVSKNGTHALFDSVAAMFNIDLVTVRQISYLIIALLVDLGGIRCLMILTAKETKRETGNPYNTGDATNETNETSQIATNETNETKVTKPVATNETKARNQKSATKKPCNEFETLKRKIASGEYGSHPTMKACITGMMRHPMVSQAFKELTEEGVLIKEGRKYKLINKTNVVELH